MKKILSILFLMSLFCLLALSCNSPKTNNATLPCTCSCMYENSATTSTQSAIPEDSINSESSSTEAHSRDAVWTDFKWDCVKAERSVTFRILPNCDIENMIVQVSFRDSNLDTLETKVIIIGDVIQGNEVVFVHTLADNAFTKGKIIYGCHLSLRSGTVYL